MQPLFGQTINGIVLNEDKQYINATILIKTDSISTEVKEYAIARNGHFEIQLKNHFEKVFIEVIANGYQSLFLNIDKPVKSRTYQYEFVLQRLKIEELEEIIIEAEKRRFVVKKDTVSYNVERYLDGSERKIKDVIKKLPGIEVNEQSGEIRYKGRSIETVTLDGDNLFGNNYTIGTKNINVNIVDQIEAIDNYSENPLLKGIEQGDKVSLNLKLKKGKFDISGDVEMSSGLFDNADYAGGIGATLLGVNKYYKSFITTVQNNVGVNNSPLDYFGANQNVEQKKEAQFFSKKIISETLFSNLIDDSRANINNQFFGSLNSLFKLSDRIKVRTNIFYLNDKIITNQLFKNQYNIYNEELITSDNVFMTKKPKQYRGDVQINYNTSNTSLLEYNLRLRYENIKTSSEIVQNESDMFGNLLETNDFYFNQSLLWTNKLSDKKALQFSMTHAINRIPQRFSISPSLLEINSFYDIQESEFNKTYLDFKAILLASTDKDKYSFVVGGNLDQNPYISNLYSYNAGLDILTSNSKNNFNYTKKSVFNHGRYNFNRNNWVVSPSYSITLLKQDLNDNLLSTNVSLDNFIFEPSISVKYRLNNAAFLMASASYNENTNAEEYFYINQVLVNNRTLISNVPSLNLMNSQVFNMLYFKNDLFKQFQLNANISYQKSTGNFFSNTTVTENILQLQYFFSPQNRSNFSSGFHVSKYIPFIESNIELSSNYSLSNYQNIVNNSSLRDNKIQFLTSQLVWKTAFDIPINFENKFSWQYSLSKSIGNNAFINKAIQNSFNVHIKPFKTWRLILSSDYYLPDTDDNNSFFFLDTNILHLPKNEKWQASLKLRNLTNEKNFQQIQTSDISTTVFKSNLLPFHFLFSVSLSF